VGPTLPRASAGWQNGMAEVPGPVATQGMPERTWMTSASVAQRPSRWARHRPGPSPPRSRHCSSKVQRAHWLSTQMGAVTWLQSRLSTHATQAPVPAHFGAAEFFCPQAVGSA
jgi:hypothetical protein